MKKALAILLSLVMVFLFVACGTTDDSSSSSFEKPENYASVLLVTINPQFRLYLDENGTVLAVEAVNEDAKTFEKSISFENENYETVVKEIVKKANDNGFVKADATVNIQVSEKKSESVDVAEILNKATATATAAATELEIEIKVTAEDKTVENENSSSSEATPPSDNLPQDETSSKAESSESSSAAEESKPATSSKDTVSSHSHKYSSATCTKPKTCSCGATKGSALGHKYSEGVCARCDAKDPDFKYIEFTSGDWCASIVEGEFLYQYRLVIEAEPYISFSESYKATDEDIANYPDEVFLYDGVYYCGGLGDGDGLEFSENGNTVTASDTDGNTITLERVSNKVLKVTKVDGKFMGHSRVVVGTEFVYEER